MAAGTSVTSGTTAAHAADPPAPHPRRPSFTCTTLTSAIMRNPHPATDPTAEDTIPTRSAARLIRAVLPMTAPAPAPELGVPRR
ncbi:unnamed protein product [Urochloa decumbens]|uniref:Uncharacterized protein n=1 Tax=Urochloa decumbens TaxID=240449 RepID=A0ABC9F048_9POAL